MDMILQAEYITKVVVECDVLEHSNPIRYQPRQEHGLSFLNGNPSEENGCVFRVFPKLPILSDASASTAAT